MHQQTLLAPEESLSTQDNHDKAVQVHHRLCQEYGCPIHYFHTIDPLSELVSALLSHRTRNADSAKAFRELRSRFPNWEAVRDAPTAEVEDAVASCTWPEQKAPRLQAVLRDLTRRRDGQLSLAFLKDMPVEEARKWLETISGVGPKTSAAVISFSTLRGKALPVDSHHFRVAVRLGLLPSAMSVGPSHRVLEAQLPDDWDAQAVYDNHQVMMKHGKKTCTHLRPQCDKCVILAWCPHPESARSAPIQCGPGSAIKGDVRACQHGCNAFLSTALSCTTPAGLQHGHRPDSSTFLERTLMRLAFSILATILSAAAVAAPATAATQPETLPSGVKIQHLTEGKGASPKASDTVTVHYRGTLDNGKEFDSSYSRNEPASFPLSRVIPCWTQGVQKMKVGGKAKLVCPPDTAYGSRGAGASVPPNSTLNFEVELLSIDK